VSRPRRWWLLVGVVALLAFVSALAVRHEVFPYFSGDNDEPVMRYQAEMLRDGEVTIPRVQEEFFRPWLTGPDGDRLVPAFQPLWPAILMASEVVTGSMVLALGLAAAGLVVATFLLARELLAGDARAVLATVLVAGAPFVLTLSGTYLAYVLATVLGTALTAAALRGLRTESRLAFVLAGAFAGLLVLTRPYDAILWCLPPAGFALATRRRELRRLVASIGWCVVGLAPLLVVALGYNALLTGSITTFGTTAQSQGTAVLGWGVRSIAPDTPILDFTPALALTSLRDNVWALPTWLLGSYLAVFGAAYGALRLWRENRGHLALLLAMTVIFPLGYVAWWTTALTVGGAKSGIGPHYYLPMVVPLGILAAHGCAEATARLRVGRRTVLVAAVTVSLVLTAVAVVPKLDEKRAVADGGRADVRVVADARARAPGPVLVIQERRWSPYVMEPYPYFANDPDLDNEVLYALDRGANDIDLLARYPDRTAYRLVRRLEPDDEVHRLPLVALPQTVARGSSIALHTRITNRTGDRRVIAYVRWGARRVARLLDGDSVKGRVYDVVWTITPAGIDYGGPPAPAAHPPRRSVPEPSEALEGTTPAPPEDLIVGASFARAATVTDPARSELHYYGRVAGSRGEPIAEMLTAPASWSRLPAPYHAWLPLDVARSLHVRPDPRPGT
jgi:hypothetical protein